MKIKTLIGLVSAFGIISGSVIAAPASGISSKAVQSGAEGAKIEKVVAVVIGGAPRVRRRPVVRAPVVVAPPVVRARPLVRRRPGAAIIVR